LTQPLVVGLCGAFSSGCTIVSSMLSDEHHEQHPEPPKCQIIRLSEKVRVLAKAWGYPDARKGLQDAGNRIRKEKGPDYLALWAIDEIKKDSDFVVLDGIRNVAEVIALRRQCARFFLLGVGADKNVRRDRSIFKKKMSLEEFEEADSRDEHEELVHGQQVGLCMGFSDAILRNDDDVDPKSLEETESLRKNIRRFYTLFSQDGDGEPSYDEILMGMADDAAMLSHCLRRRVGAVVCATSTSKAMKDVGEDETDSPRQVPRFRGPQLEVIAVGRNDPPPSEKPCKFKHGMCYREQIRQERRQCPDCEKEIIEFECPHCGTKVRTRGFTGKELDYCRSLHAEEHAIIQMAKRPGGIPDGAQLFTTTFPCFLCAQKIVTVGITKVTFSDPYPSPESWKVLSKAKVVVEPFEGIRSKAFHRVFSRPPGLTAQVEAKMEEMREAGQHVPVVKEPAG
jgi:deoxycytidylate deaminase